LQKVPFMLVVGDQEANNRTVSVRNRFEGDKGAMAVDQVIALIRDLARTKAVRP
jgi:threonyl-tRNA synthetase